MPELKIQVGPAGEVKIDGVGFVGKSCDSVVDAFVRALGRDPSSVVRDYKPEYAQLDEQLNASGGAG